MTKLNKNNLTNLTSLKNVSNQNLGRISALIQFKDRINKY